jgi:hypothetical protein
LGGLGALALFTALVAIPANATAFTFNPVADSYVNSAAPSTNYGGSTRLRVDASPKVRSFLRFSVQGISGSVSKATLRLYAVDGSSDGYKVRSVSDTTWGETGITYNNAPAFSSPVLGKSGSIRGSSWTQVDVTSVVAGNGTYSFGLITRSTTRIRFSSKEGTNAPQLVVETGADTAAPPAPTGVSASAVDFNWVNVSWAASPGGVTGYTLYRNGTEIATVPSSTLAYNDTTVAPGTAYDYQVDAFDAANNRSTKSAKASITTAGSPSYPVIAAAGDIACDPGSSSFNSGNGTTSSCHQKYTSNSLVNAGFDAVLPLGDTQYDSGDYNDYLLSYDPTWGRVKSITHPAVGNHEYGTSNASGYFQYFGAAAGDPTLGYYSYDLGAWHLIALNANIAHDAASAQVTWLKSDLAASTKTCTLAYWHQPRWSSGPHGSDAGLAPFWDSLYDAAADLVLVGHDHNYERFAPQNKTGAADAANGVREFVVGTGGATHYNPSTAQPNSEVRNGTQFGILMVRLQASSYSWRFVPEAGGTFTDSGSTACH